ncbi:MAG TPA: DUF58 domain-containing protein [Candidatus Omnitrophota bacterium]|nr:DUF58 domain-containing protein [Candidatus Omnitrophota bacterium]
MIPKDLFKKIRQIEISTNRLVTDVFAGQYHSVFKGQGIEFDEVREYHHGDDVRFIDWNVTARTGKPHIKKFVEERELSVMILVDASMSCRFGTVQQLKSSMAAEIAAILAFSAIRNHDKVGLIIFTDKIEKFIPPRKGTSHVLRVIREILYFKPQGRLTDISLALDYLHKVTTRKTVVFLISDFMMFHSENNKKIEYLFKKDLSIANRKHDMIAITLNDPKENSLPDAGLVAFKDAETGEEIIVDSADKNIRNLFEETSRLRQESRKDLFISTGVDHIDISTDRPYTKSLVRFFKERQKRLAKG